MSEEYLHTGRMSGKTSRLEKEAEALEQRVRESGCTCRYEWRSLGRLYNVSFGKGWVRMNDAPDCPQHGRRDGPERADH